MRLHFYLHARKKERKSRKNNNSYSKPNQTETKKPQPPNLSNATDANKKDVILLYTCQPLLAH